MNACINKWNGRLGNNIMQIAKLLWCKKINNNIRIIGMPKHSILNTKSLIESKNPMAKTVYSKFFYSKDVKKLNINTIPTLEELYTIIRTEIYEKVIPNDIKIEKLSNSTLVIHIRSGDCFGSMPHPSYVPPPQSYYIKCINDHIKTIPETDKIIIVTEPDKRNPSIKGTVEYVKANYIDINIIIQSSSVKKDIATLIASQYLITSIGFFGRVATVLSPNIKMVYISCCSSIIDKDKQSLRQIHQLPIVYQIDDYTLIGKWIGSPQQKSLISTHSKNKVIKIDI